MPCLPNPAQQKVLDWVDKVRKGQYTKKGIPILYLQGGVGAGKTRAIMAPVVEMLLEIPSLRVLWSRQDFNDLRLSAMETFFEVIPPEIILEKNTQEHRYVIKQNYGDKSQIFFRELKDLSGLGSQEFGIIVITEASEISEQAFITLKMRVRQSNVPIMILMEGNPPNESHWLAERTNPNHPNYDSDIEMWEVSTYENWDNLPLSQRQSLEKMPESWKHKYLLGKFGFTPDGKPFYQGFTEVMHKKKLEFKPTQSSILYRSWDYGFHFPAISIHTFDSRGRWLILKEVMGQDITIEKFGEFIKLKCKEWYPECAQWVDYGDPAGMQKTDKSEKTSVEILASMGISVVSRQSMFRERKEIIERKLTTLIDGMPSLLVDESCKIIIDGFLGGYHYPVRNMKQAFNPATMEIPYDDGYYIHLLNSVEYFAVNQFTGSETKEDNTETTYRVVGDLGDVRYENDEDNSYSPAYNRVIDHLK